ncbi:hypothetical protein [Leptospira noguchii]|uniref:Uncharacterized protein n=1 Tax=Leptospira noguchii TaxID=28182 RepID=A0AAE9KC86_9LEPT|nr:hypothetical protein [Leptospira noguchii]UOG32483.1 hypothetical protein MAL06_18610 [Leptospira noguchii]UOG58592.1 hypothetical protein MAL03_18105 [Leptospira noguchii]
MLRSVVSSIEFEKFRRNWSENEQLSVSLLLCILCQALPQFYYIRPY